jgi:hypothetical protein
MAITQNYQLNLGFLEIGISDKSSNFYSLSKFWFVLNYKIEKSRAHAAIHQRNQSEVIQHNYFISTFAY